MKFKYAIISDNAFGDEAGRTNIIQTYDIILTKGFPAMHPRLTITTKYELEDTDDKKKKYVQLLKIVEQKTGRDIFKATQNVTPEEGKANHIEFISKIVGIQFEKEGKYNIEIKLDDEKIDSDASFLVKQVSNGRN